MSFKNLFRTCADQNAASLIRMLLVYPTGNFINECGGFKEGLTPGLIAAANAYDMTQIPNGVQRVTSVNTAVYNDANNAPGGPGLDGSLSTFARCFGANMAARRLQVYIQGDYKTYGVVAIDWTLNQAVYGCIGSMPNRQCGKPCDPVWLDVPAPSTLYKNTQPGISYLVAVGLTAAGSSSDPGLVQFANQNVAGGLAASFDITRICADSPARPIYRQRAMNANLETVALEHLHAAAPYRQPGYLQECLNRGVLDRDAQTLTFTRADWQAIRQRFSIHAEPIDLIRGCRDC